MFAAVIVRKHKDKSTDSSFFIFLLLISGLEEIKIKRYYLLTIYQSTPSAHESGHDSTIKNSYPTRLMMTKIWALSIRRTDAHACHLESYQLS